MKYKKYKFAKNMIERFFHFNRIFARKMNILSWENWSLVRRNLILGEPEMEFVGKLCHPSLLSIDVGASQGVYSLLAKKYSGAVLAFEPNPLNRAELNRRLPWLEIEECALSNRSGQTVLRVPSVNGTSHTGWGTIDPDNNFKSIPRFDIKVFSVPLRTLDSFAFSNVGFIKIDVEGHEWEVVQGANSLIDQCRPNIIIEIEERHKPGNIKRITEFFHDKKYSVWFYDECIKSFDDFNLALDQNEDNISIGRYINNFIFVPLEKKLF